MTNESGRNRQRASNLRDELIWGLNQVTKGWLVGCIGVKAILKVKVISWRSVTQMFPDFLTPVLTQLFCPKPPTTFPTCFCRGESYNTPERKFASTNNNNNNQGLISKPAGHEANTLTTESSGRGVKRLVYNFTNRTIKQLWIFSIKKESVTIIDALILFIFNTPLLIIYLSYIEPLICRREMSLIGSNSFGFAQNTIHDFQNTVLNS